MALPYPISSAQTDCRSPIDDTLMDSIRLNLDYLDSAVAGSSSNIFQWKVNGKLSLLSNYKQAIDSGSPYESFTPQGCRASIRNSGYSGSVMIDILRHKKITLPITGINAKSRFSTQSVARMNVGQSTQSISLATPTINTQSISFAKATISVTSIINVDGNKWRYNLSSAPDADYLVGDYITVAGASSGANNGLFQLIEVNQSDYPSVVVNNASGVAQTTASGTIQLMMMSYNHTNPVDTTYFASALSFISASHTTSANNGTFVIRKINQSGNNIWIMNSVGVVQAGVAGTCQTACWSYNMSSAVSTTGFVVGETAVTASHSTGANNGTFTIISVNISGNNIALYNTAGVAQGGVAGTIASNRWVFTALTARTTTVTVGDRFKMSSHTSSLNDGTFTVVDVDQGGGANFNIVVHNSVGVAQAGVAGICASELKLVKFSTDQSAVFTTGTSLLEILGAVSGFYNRQRNKYLYSVVDQNFGGGANYNAVIKEIDGPEQDSPAGFVDVEAKSIFTAPQSIVASANQFIGDSWLVENLTSALEGSLIDQSEVLGLYCISVQTGEAEDLSVTLF